MLAAGLLVLWTNGVLDKAGDAVLAALVVTVVLGLISAPFWWSMVRRLEAEKMARSAPRSEPRSRPISMTQSSRPSR